MKIQSLATILNIRLRPEETSEELIRLPPPRRVEGVDQPFQMRGITIPGRLRKHAYERQRRRQEFMREDIIQPKLVIGEPNGRYGQEADRIAEEETLQAKEFSCQTSELASDFESRIQTMRGGGQPLPESARDFFEPWFGYDFSGVRVHTNAHSAKLARAMNARAFTVGRDVVFEPREYAPDSNAGKRLLAHEFRPR